MNQCINSGLPVFSVDLDVKGTKKFIACGYQYFCESLYNKAANKHHYELLQYDKPTKIYMDFDDSEGDPTFWDQVYKFVAVLLQLIENKYNVSNVPVYILDGTSSTKQSTHVIVEFFLSNISMVKDMISVVALSQKCDFIDMSVYSRNRSFRLLYSKKFGKDDSSVLRVKGEEDSPYDPALVFRTMIQAFVPPHYTGVEKSWVQDLCRTVYAFYPPKDIQKLLGENGGSKYNYSMLSSAPQFLDDFVRQLGGSILSLRESDICISGIVGGIKCPWKGEEHKNNNQYMTVMKKNLHGWFECADPDCPGAPYYEFDGRWMWS